MTGRNDATHTEKEDATNQETTTTRTNKTDKKRTRQQHNNTNHTHTHRDNTQDKPHHPQQGSEARRVCECRWHITLCVSESLRLTICTTREGVCPPSALSARSGETSSVMGGTSLVRIRHRLLPSHLFSSCVFFFTFLVSLSVSWVGADSSSSSAAATLAAARSGIQPINIASSNVATTLLRQASAAYAVEQLTFDATTTQVASSGLLAAHLSGAYDLTVCQ